MITVRPPQPAANTDWAAYRSWPHWRLATLVTRAARATGPLQATSCATCWGQRVVWESVGWGLIPMACQACTERLEEEAA